MKWELVSTSSFDLPAEALVILVHELNVTSVIGKLPIRLAEYIQQDVDQNRFQAKRGQLVSYPTMGHMQSRSIVLIGLGDIQADPNTSAETMRQAGNRLAKHMQSNRIASAHVDTHGFVQQGMMFREGFELGLYRKPSFARDQADRFDVQSVTLHVPTLTPALKQAFDHVGVATEAVCYARDLVNKPGNHLVPEDLAQEAEALGRQYDHLEVNVLREDELLAMNMGAIWAVGKGSVNKPRMITIRYMGDPTNSEIIGLIGKGITFDTGGISIKPSAKMENMINDMGGAAAVLAAMRAIAQIRPKKNVLIVIPTAENMPSSNAYKPGDVVTSYSKRTIEVVNTDAEGRVVLADAITYAKELGATKLIDIATLTGAMVYCLGNEITGVVSNHDSFFADFEASAKRTNESVHRLPVVQAYRDQIKSPVADVRNSTGGHPGAITAGLFLGTFAEETPWIHLDIAGTGWLDAASGYLPKGGTGVMVRTFLDYVLKG